MQLKNFLLPAFIAAFNLAGAQPSPSKDSVKTALPRNLFKVNITSLPLKNYSVQYEHVLSKKISIAISGRFMPTTTIPFKNLVIDAVADGDQDVEDIINKAQFGNVAITPELRFYLGKGYGKGFYIAPYYRFVDFSTNTIPVTYSETNGPERTVNLNGKLTANTGGLLFGAQWFLGKHICLDWWILGAQYGSGNGSFNGVPGTPFTPQEQADVRQALEDIDIPLVNKTVNVTANNVLVKLTGPFGGLRGGILLGIRF